MNAQNTYMWYDSLNGEWIHDFVYHSWQDALLAFDGAMQAEELDPSLPQHAHNSDHYICNVEDEDDIIDVLDWQLWKQAV